MTLLLKLFFAYDLDRFYDIIIKSIGRNCNCPDNICIMAATSASMSPVHFSDCSASDLSMISGQLSCLHNVPTVSRAGPRCGNGIVEDNETCDCGEPDVCTNPCCDSSICNLVSRAECAHGVCCNTSTCQILAGGTVCRAGTGECDITEYCTGSSNECPKDYFKLDGSPCATNTGYCSNGTCPTHRAQCSEAWGKIKLSIKFTFNLVATCVLNTPRWQLHILIANFKSMLLLH